jgi:hypothetical protein
MFAITGEIFFCVAGRFFPTTGQIFTPCGEMFADGFFRRNRLGYVRHHGGDFYGVVGDFSEGSVLQK